MARPKNKRTKRNAAPLKAPIASVTERITPIDEINAEKISAVSEQTPIIEAPISEVKETTPAPKKKTKKEAVKKNDIFVIQSSGKDYTNDDIVELCKAAYRNGTRKHIKSCNVYLKAENGGIRAYYVINGNADGAFIDL